MRSPLSLWRPGRLVVVVVTAAVSRVTVGGRRVLVVAPVPSVGHAGLVGVVEVDVGGLGRLAVGGGVVVMVVMVVVVGLGHGVGSAEPAHGLLHVGVVGRGLHLQGALSGVGLVRRAPVVSVHVVDVVTEQAAVPLRGGNVSGSKVHGGLESES